MSQEIASVRIAFTGHAQSGKTTAARYLADKEPYSVVLSFAAKVKEIVHDLWDVDTSVKTPETRRLLQLVGTEAFRAIDKDVWVNYLVRKIQSYPKPLSLFVDDVRFPNEARALQDNGFAVIRIERPDLDLSDPMYQHISELAVDEIKADGVVYNVGTLERFCGTLDMFMLCRRNVPAC